MSFDGKYWQLQILAHPPRGLWSGEGHQDRLQYFRFGLWSERTGVKRVPLNPILDAGRMLAESEVLIDLIRRNLGGLPFPLVAELELWLLDRAHAPLALLATAIEGMDLDELGTPAWSAGATRNRHFVSPTLQRGGATPPDGVGLQHATTLERLVRSTAGRHRNRQWFRREADGTGVGLGHGGADGLAGRRLSAACFSELPVRTNWPEDGDTGLVADWIDWIAPYLLTLPGIGDELRGRLEQEAAREPLLVDALWRLYPGVLDRDLLKQVRVEARLLRASTDR